MEEIINSTTYYEPTGSINHIIQLNNMIFIIVYDCSGNLISIGEISY